MEEISIGTILMLVFQGISSLCFFLCIFIINNFKTSLDGMQKTMGKLNVNIATLVSEDKSKDKRLEKVEKETDALRERYHELINKFINKLELLVLEVETIKKRLDE